jgi:hypothetical protein
VSGVSPARKPEKGLKLFLADAIREFAEFAREGHNEIYDDLADE